MSASAVRTVSRPLRTVFQRSPTRNASTTTEAANAASSTANTAKDAASQTTSKASEGLTKVTASGGKALEKGSAAVSGAVAGIGGRAGGLVSRLQSLYPPAAHYGKVGWELSKIVYRGQQMSPPTRAQVTSYFQPLINALRNPSTLFAQNPGLFQPQQYINTIRNLNRQQLATVSILVAEVIGFFTVGEMIGKAKIVGYRSSAPPAEHH